MAERQEALVNPGLLVWARKSSRLDVIMAAKKIGVAEDRLQEWENGSQRPTVPQLRKVAEIYKRPLAVFFLPEPPIGFDAMHIQDFRRSIEGHEVDISPNLAFEIRRAGQRREVAIALNGEEDKSSILAAVPVGLDDDPNQVAGAVREMLAVKIPEQFAWGDRNNAFRAWRDAIEGLGVLVFQTHNIAMEEMRGMSMEFDSYPLIILNGHDWVNGKIFSLIHELVHLILRQSGICNFNETGSAKRVESFCNFVAGSVLVPASDLFMEKSVQVHDNKLDWTDYEINALANRFGVSDEVLLRRLVILGLAPESYYAFKREQYLKLYAEKREAEKRRQKEKGSHPPHYRMIIRDNGIRYTRMVIDAYHDDNISISDVSDYLNTKIKHLMAIEQEIYRHDNEVRQ